MYTDKLNAPEISQMFGELLALSILQSWIDQGSPSKIILAELGPGRGTLMVDILREEVLCKKSSTLKLGNFFTK